MPKISEAVTTIPEITEANLLNLLCQGQQFLRIEQASPRECGEYAQVLALLTDSITELRLRQRRLTED